MQRPTKKARNFLLIIEEQIKENLKRCLRFYHPPGIATQLGSWISLQSKEPMGHKVIMITIFL